MFVTWAVGLGLHVGFKVDKFALGQVRHRVLRLSSVNIVPEYFTYALYGTCVMAQLQAAVTETKSQLIVTIKTCSNRILIRDVLSEILSECFISSATLIKYDIGGLQ
jgi:hypothetical protein